MPITKSAKKAARQAITREARRKPVKSAMKNLIKSLVLKAKTDKDAAKKELPKAYKLIDIATKKHILHKNTADRRKSRLAKMVDTK